MRKLALVFVLTMLGCSGGEVPSEPDALPDTSVAATDAETPSLDASVPDASEPLDAGVEEPDAGPSDPCLTLDCDDENPCTNDSCESLVGCKHTANTDSCDDGDACTTEDHCLNSACVGGAPPNCDDGNACTFDSCIPATGCDHTDAVDGATCGTLGQKCQGGQCQCSVGVVEICGDGTDNNCDGLTDCEDPACNGQACDDHNACTVGDVCGNSTCGGTPKVCTNTTVTCIATVGICWPSDGDCHFDPAPNGTPCDDADACTESDQCNNGICGGNTISCDDGNSCTTDNCDARTGCYNNFKGTIACTEDGFAGRCDQDTRDCCTGCKSGTACLAGTSVDACGGGDEACISCDDGNPCTADTCQPKGRDGAVFTQCGHDLLPEYTDCPSGTCVLGGCVSCGGEDQPPCSGTTCQPGMKLSTLDNLCHTCGATGDSCCYAPFGYFCDAGNYCASGTCAAIPSCGGPDERCCTEAAYDPSNPWVSGACDEGSVCYRFGAGATESYKCEPCGSLYLPCCQSNQPESCPTGNCPNGTCDSGLTCRTLGGSNPYQCR